MKANRKFSKDEEAVSPVIGVILMVAITVILAAVIAAFVFGMGSSLSKSYVVAATVSQITSSQIDVTYNGGPDADYLVFLNATVGDRASGNTTTAGLATATTPIAVGTVLTLTPTTSGGYSGKDHVIVIGTFTDGTTQIILDTYV